MSLLELLAVVMLMGIFATAAASRYGRDVIGNVGVRGEARKLSLGMLEAQRRAIKTGDNHGIQVYGPTSAITSWAMFRVLSNGSREIVGSPHAISDDYTVRADGSQIIFNFEGNGTDEFNATLDGPNRQWTIRVLPLTRMLDCRETTS